MSELLPAVELRGLTKRFGAVVANAGINMQVATGAIHGVVGENGAGKSTAMKLLYGIYQPDAGEILVAGKRCVWTSPADAIATGIGMVHQHFMLAGPYSALDNILLGAEPLRHGIIDRKVARAQLEQLMRQYALPVEPDRPVEELPVGLQQRVEILKLLFRRANILILDEPTSVLTPQEAQTLFANLRKLRDEGKTILIITHKLKEVLALTDRVTVFRAGKVVGEVQTSRTNAQELATLMVGRKVALEARAAPAHPQAEPAMEVSDLTLQGRTGSRSRLSHLSFSIQRGEILGVAGVEGNGQSELVQAILHPADPACRTSGTVRILSQDVTECSAREIRDLGVALIPEDRQHQGLLPERPISENFLLGFQRASAFNRGGFLNLKRLTATVRQALADADIRPNDLTLAAGRLSGGNQQKLIVAREFQRQAKVVIAAHPTQGVDVGAIEAIHARIVQARDDGVGVLLISSELDEIFALSDRIVVMYEGRLVAEYRRDQVSEPAVGLKMGGG
jgi:simple sugar transport system ATP-binding protein